MVTIARLVKAMLECTKVLLSPCPQAGPPNFSVSAGVDGRSVAWITLAARAGGIIRGRHRSTRRCDLGPAVPPLGAATAITAAIAILRGPKRPSGSEGDAPADVAERGEEAPGA